LKSIEDAYRLIEINLIVKEQKREKVISMRNVFTFFNSFCHIYGFFSVIMVTGIIFLLAHSDSAFNIAILGLGGRSQYVLLECLQFNKNIRVVAIADDYAHDSLNFFLNKLQQRHDPLLQAYSDSYKHAAIYPDTQEGLQKLFATHTDLDMVFITSANYHHSRHLGATLTYSSCKNIYMEKPLFKDLQEFTKYKLAGQEKDILIGLTLRYSSMAGIVVQNMQAYKTQLGRLQRVRAWERVKFCQGLTAFMMSWRRYISLSGGLLLEKSIHDLDLALFFISSLGIDPQEINVTTTSSHAFFNQSHKKNILHEMLHNDVLKKTLIGREFSPFQRFISFSFDQAGNIDWPLTLDAIFRGFPDDDTFDHADIIPDYHKLSALLMMPDGNSVDFELEVDLGGLRVQTERGMKFEFEGGHVTIDVMESMMKIILDENKVYQFDLKTNQSDHADGDAYIAQAILGILPQGQYNATFCDPIVQLATIMSLVSEQQSLSKKSTSTRLRKLGNQWTLKDDGVDFETIRVSGKE